MELVKELNVDAYAISIDTPTNLGYLKAALDERFDETIDFLSDPDMVLIDRMDMKNSDVAYRGVALMDKDGKKLDSEWDDNFGTNLEKILEKLKKDHDIE